MRRNFLECQQRVLNFPNNSLVPNLGLYALKQSEEHLWEPHLQKLTLRATLLDLVIFSSYFVGNSAGESWCSFLTAQLLLSLLLLSLSSFGVKISRTLSKEILRRGMGT